jgi:hypothetical protein
MSSPILYCRPNFPISINPDFYKDCFLPASKAILSFNIAFSCLSLSISSWAFTSLSEYDSSKFSINSLSIPSFFP